MIKSIIVDGQEVEVIMPKDPEHMKASIRRLIGDAKQVRVSNSSKLVLYEQFKELIESENKNS